MITSERLKELVIYEPTTGIFTWRISRGGCVKQGATAGSLTNGYVSIAIDAKRYKAHRLAWLYVFGVWPKDEIDHIDTNKSNNRIANLREATHSENMQNQRSSPKTSATGLMGAHFYKRTKKWQASITVGGNLKHLGYFNTANEAHDAYLKAKRELHEFCTL